jgi:Zn-dependent protease with chaperone function
MRPRSSLLLPSPPALALYAATLVAEVPVIFTRMLLTLAGTALLLLVTGGKPGNAAGWVDLGLLPTAWSVLALVTPFGGGLWWEMNMGGRDPSEREQQAYNDALQLLRHHTIEPLCEPSGWFVIDTPHPDAAVCGETLMLSRGLLLESEYLPAVLAHELGHLASSDGKLTAALNRLVIHPRPTIREKDPEPPHHPIVVAENDKLLLAITLFGAILWLARKTIRFAQGGLGLRFTGPPWGAYWREREYTADQYAAQLGQAEELADFLEVHALIHDHPVPFIWLTEHSHPPTELRIDKLRKTGHTPTPTPDPSPDGPFPGHPQTETP